MRTGPAIMALILLTSPAFAQDGKKKDEPYPLILRTFRIPAPEGISEQLSLTEEQIADMHDEFAEMEMQLKQVRKKERKKEKTAREIERELVGLRAEFVETLRDMLTPEQLEKSDRLTRGRRPRGFMKKMQPDNLKTELDLSEEQYIEVRDRILHGIQEDMKEIRRLYKKKRKKQQEESRALWQEVLADLRVILTKEQQQKLHKLLQRKDGK
jgi:hypothetical protein